MKKNWPLAGQVARKLGMVPTGANVETVLLAIESEADYSGISVAEAANLIVKAAQEWTKAGNGYRCPAEWEHRNAFQLNLVDRFWFEDARWRGKYAYAEFLRERQQVEGATLPREAVSAIMAEEQSR